MPAETTAFGEFFSNGLSSRADRTRSPLPPPPLLLPLLLLLLPPPPLLLPLLGCPIQVDGTRLEAVGGEKK